MMPCKSASGVREEETSGFFTGRIERVAISNREREP